MKFQYGEMFGRLGVEGMGRRGSGWCGINKEGILVIMSHQNFFSRENGTLVYFHPGNSRAPTISASAASSIRMIANYFEPGCRVLLPIGVFDCDGGWTPEGQHIPSKFNHANGDAYKATIREFDARTAHFICDVGEKFRP